MVGVEDRQALQGLEKHFCRGDVQSLVRAMRARNELRGRATGNVCLKDQVRVVEIRDDQVKVGKVVSHLLGELASTGEKGSQCARFNGFGTIYQSSCHR